MDEKDLVLQVAGYQLMGENYVKVVRINDDFSVVSKLRQRDVALHNLTTLKEAVSAFDRTLINEAKKQLIGTVGIQH